MTMRDMARHLGTTVARLRAVVTADPEKYGAAKARPRGVPGDMTTLRGPTWDIPAAAEGDLRKALEGKG